MWLGSKSQHLGGEGRTGSISVRGEPRLHRKTQLLSPPPTLPLKKKKKELRTLAWEAGRQGVKEQSNGGCDGQGQKTTCRDM